MAKLDEASLTRLKSALDRCEEPWILAAYSPKKLKPLSASLEGTLGYLDWRLHGQFSLLIKRGQVQESKLALIPSRRQLGKASLLVYHASSGSRAQEVVAALAKLNAQAVSLAVDTWPEEIGKELSKLLTKAGIQWKALGEEGVLGDV